MSYEQRPHGPSRSSTTPIIKDIFRTAIGVLTESSSSSPHRSNSRRHRSPSPPRRAYTQPADHQPRHHHSHSRDRSYTEYDHSAAREHSRGEGEGLEDLLRKAAHELSNLVGGFEAKLKRRGGVPAGPDGIRNDDDRFEELSDEDLPNTPPGYRSAPANGHGAGSPVEGYPQQSRGLADEYYYGSSSGGIPPTPPNGGQDYPPYGGSRHSNSPYIHPQPVAPSYPDHYHQSQLYQDRPSSSSRPKPKRSSTSSAMRQVGGEMLQNLPALLQRAGWLLNLLEAQQMRSGGRKKIKNLSGLLMAISLVSGLYRRFQSEGGSRRSNGRR